MKTYSIVDIDGNVYAHDIDNEIEANLILGDIIEQLAEEKSIEEIKELYLEVI